MLRYGCTRLEVGSISNSSPRLSNLTIYAFSQIGVQSVYEDVARDTNRGHTVQATCESFHLAKDAGFKVVSHMMVRRFFPSYSTTPTNGLFSLISRIYRM